MSQPSPSSHASHQAVQAAEACERVASTVSERKADAQVLGMLRQAESACAASGDGIGPDRRTALAQLAAALEAWRTVWPRLGKDPEFRAAVVRECGTWARRLRALAKAAAPS